MGKISNNTRDFIFQKDNYECVRCKSKENLTIDHILPVSKGGTGRRFNLQTLCYDCNQLKGNSEINYREWPEFILGDDLPVINKKKDKFTPYSFKKTAPKKTEEGIPYEFKEEMLRCESSFIIHNGRKCLEYGKLNTKIGYGATIGQRVFYDNIDDKLILEYAGTIISYHFGTISNLVTKNTYAPMEYTKILPKIKRTKIKVPKVYSFSEITTPKDLVTIERNKFDIEKWKQEPEPNFHCQD